MTQKSNLTALKRETNKAIEDGNFDRADELARELCEMQGFEDTQAMPEDFYLQLKRKAGKGTMKVNKKLVKVAVAALVLSTSAVTVSAGVYHHIRESKHIESGIVAYDDDSSVNVEASSWGASVSEFRSGPEDSSESQFDATKLPSDGDENDTETKIIESKKGAEGDVWLKKTVKEEVDNGHYASDDGVNWEKDPQYYRRTEHTFNDFAAACREANMFNIFDREYTLKENGCYTHNECKENKKDKEYTPLDDTINASFSYNKGYFTVNESKDCDDTSASGESESRVFVAVADKTTNERDYDSKNNLHFALTDTKEGGKLMTFTVLSFDNYDVSLNFYNLSEKEIHEILDSISVK